MSGEAREGLSPRDLERVTFYGPIKEKPLPLEGQTAIDNFLTNARKRRRESGSGRFSPTADLPGFFRATIVDAIENKAQDHEFEELERMFNAAPDVVIGKANKQDRDDIKIYLETQHKYWEKKADLLKKEAGKETDEKKAEQVRQEASIAHDNQSIFESFQGALDNPLDDLDFPSPDVAVQEELGTPDKQNGAKEADTKYEQPPLPKEYKPGEKLETFFEGIKGKTEEEIEEEIVSLKPTMNFVTTQILDIQEQENPHILLINAVEGARKFLSKLEDPATARTSGKVVVVIDRNGQVSTVGWEKAMKDKDIEGTKYRFDPSTSGEYPTFDDYAERCQQYQNLLKGTDGAEGLNKAQKLLQELTKSSRKKMSREALQPIIVAIDRQGQLINAEMGDLIEKYTIKGAKDRDEMKELLKADQPAFERYEELERQAKILDRFMELVLQRKGHNLFSGIKNKLGRGSKK